VTSYYAGDGIIYGPSDSDIYSYGTLKHGTTLTLDPISSVPWSTTISNK